MAAPNIAVIGPLRSGKDSVVLHLASHHGYTRMSFAEPLKEEVVKALSAVDGNWSLEKLEMYKTRLRPLLQVWGTELRRAADPEYWVRQVEARIRSHHASDHDRIAVADARFTNELDMLKRHQFVIVRLKMADKTLRAHLKKVAGMTDAQIDSALSHPSEREWQAYPADVTLTSTPGRLNKVFEGVEALL